MKYQIALLIFLFPAFALGQNAKIRTDTAVIKELLESWTLGLPEEGDEPADIRVFNKFKNLFLPEATVVDFINADFKPTVLDDPNPYKTETKTVEFYAHDIALEFKNLKIDSAYAIEINEERLKQDSIVTVKLTLRMSGEKYRRYVMDDIGSLIDSLAKFRKNEIEELNRDAVIRKVTQTINEEENGSYKLKATSSLLVTMMMKKDTIKITNIRDAGVIENVDCLNDEDNDGVLDEEDSCRNSRGDLTAFGCVDSDFDGIPDSEDACNYIYGVSGNHGCPADYFSSSFAFSATVGMQINSVKLNMPELDKLGYTSIDFNESNNGSLKNPGYIPSPVVGIDLSYFFGKRKKNKGITLGLTYTGFTATYEIADPAVYTYKADDGADEYRRRITLKEGSIEEMRYNILNIPLLFTYRFMSGKNESAEKAYNMQMSFSAGPSLLLFSNTSEYNSNIDFEGLYQVDTINQDAITYYDYFDNASDWNILLTANNINNQSAIPGADSVFSWLDNNGYDFASDRNYSGEEKNLNRTSIALNAKFDALYKFSDQSRLAFKFGVSLLFAPLPGQSAGYQLIDKTTDPYSSFYNSNPKCIYFSAGIYAGLVIQL